MLSALQKTKISRLFELIDSGEKGVLDESDYATIAGNLAQVRGWPVGSSEHSALLETYLEVWRALKGMADTDGDGTVRRLEHAAYHEKLLASPGGYERVPGAMASFLVETFDRDGDGFLTLDDLRDFYTAYRISADEATLKAAFTALDAKADGKLSHAEVLARVQEFYFSDDPAAPGNSLFGPLR